MHEELASIREIVWLTSTETLDRAELLLSQLGYFTTHRSDYSLTAQRPATSASAEHDTSMLTLTASPQAKGGVKVAVRGDDREGMQAYQHYQEGERCMLAFLKSSADSSKECAHPTTRPPISATHPHTPGIRE